MRVNCHTYTHTPCIHKLRPLLARFGVRQSGDTLLEMTVNCSRARSGVKLPSRAVRCTHRQTSMIDTTCGYRAGGDATGDDISSHPASVHRAKTSVSRPPNTPSTGPQRYHREKIWDGEKYLTGVTSSLGGSVHVEPAPRLSNKSFRMMETAYKAESSGDMPGRVR